MTKTNAFTLIEMVVVVAVLMVSFGSIVGVMLNSFKANRQSDVRSDIEAVGTAAMAELRKNVLNSSTEELLSSCTGVVGTTINLRNRFDGGLTTITCNSAAARISSGSANVLGTGVAIDCSNFVSCANNGGEPVVRFSFVLTAGGVSRDFTQSFSLRD